MIDHGPILVMRAPRPEFRPFVDALWAMEGAADGARRTERVLPTGHAHLALRISGDPFRLCDAPGAPGGHDISHAVVGGARATPYTKEIGAPAISVGALLRPGAASHLFGVPADELAHRHTPLDALWGAAVEETRERLFEAGTAERRLEVLEAVLAARLPRVRGLHPAVAHALGRLAHGVPVGEVVRETGYSHRHFIALFRGATGLGPKRFSRVARFNLALGRLAGDPAVSPSRVAYETGYADQAHLIREFRAHAGVTPAAYLRLAGGRPHHLAVDRAEG